MWFLLIKRGFPRYFASLGNSFILKIFLILALVLVWVFLEKKQPDLLKLIRYPIQLQYWSRHFLNSLTSSRLALSILTLWIFPSISNLRSILESNSKYIMNRKGDKGSPCLIPLSISILLKTLPFRSNSTDSGAIHLRTRAFNLWEKPNLEINLVSTPQSTRS